MDSSFRSPTLLLDGVPAQGEVATGEYQYYYAHLVIPNGTSVFVLVTAESGDPQLYMTTDGTEPGPANHQFASSASSGSTFVNIKMAPGDAGYCFDCSIYVAVYGQASSSFTITLQTQDAIGRLAAGKSRWGQVDSNGYVYYTVGVPGDSTDVSISLTVLTGGSLRLVAAPLAVNSRPTVGDYTWQSGEQGRNVLQILHTDANACTSCSYVIGVFGSSPATTSFTITATEAGVTTLLDGHPQDGHVANLAYTYYSFTFPAGARYPLTFRINPTSGSVEMYLTNEYIAGVSPLSDLPARDNNPPWSTLLHSNNTTPNSITVTTSSPYYNASLTHYTLGVLGASASTFTISATTANMMQTLALGTPSTHQHVDADATVYFTVSMDSNTEELTISVTQLSGNTYLLVTDTPGVIPGCSTNMAGNIGCFNYTWKSSNDGVDVVTILPGQYTANSQFTIGVYGTSAAQFTILASTYSRFTLTDGRPQIATTTDTLLCLLRDPDTGACLSDTHYQQAAFFEFETTVPSQDEAASDVSITISQACTFDGTVNDCGADLDYYVMLCSTSICSPEAMYPGEYMFVYSNVVTDGSATLFLSSSQVRERCLPENGLCSFYIGVYPAGNTTATLQAYYTTTNLALLSESCMTNRICDPPSGLLAAGGSSNYELFTGNQAGSELTVTIEGCNGYPSLYVCTPNCNNPYAPSQNNNDFSVHTSPTNAQAHLRLSPATGTYYVDVANDMGSGDLVYHLTASLGSAVPRMKYGGGFSVSSVSTDSATLTWNLAQLKTGAVSADASQVTYTVYYMKGSFPSDAVVTTKCGLQYTMAANEGTMRMLSAGTDVTSVTVGDLDSGASYSFVLSSTRKVDGQEWDAVYPAVTASTESPSLGAGVIIVIVLCCLSVPACAVGIWWYRRSKQKQREQQYDMADVSGVEAVVSQPATNYRPLMDDEDDGFATGRASLAMRIRAGLSRNKPPPGALPLPGSDPVAL